jgi:hypothetical protein
MSIFSALGKVAGKLKGLAGKAVAATVPGGGAVMAAGGLLGKIGKRVDRKVLKGAVIGGGAAAVGAGMMGAFGGRSPSRRYRRVNPGNFRAMRRAIRRVEAGAKAYSRLFGIKHGHIKGAPKVFVKRRRRAA